MPSIASSKRGWSSSPPIRASVRWQDTLKGADLGGSGDRLVLDFNYAYHPSCAYDPRWSCPLAPPTSRLDARIEAGERLG